MSRVVPQPISGFRIEGYRTLLDAKVECDGPLTIICGPNNAGKSSLLQALLVYPTLVAAMKDRNGVSKRGAEVLASPSARVSLGVPVRGGRIERAWVETGGAGEFGGVADEFCSHLGDERIWIPFGPHDQALRVGDPSPVNAQVTKAMRGLTGQRSRDFLNAMQSMAGAHRQSFSVDSAWICALAEDIAHPEITHIADVRREADRPLSAAELGVLAKASALRSDGTRREKWTETLALILKDTFGDGVEYYVPPEGDSGTFQLAIDGDRDIDLSSVGAGVREVVAVAYKALHAGDRSVLLIEEPENCLHPMAVRRMLHSLVTRAGLQVIASTHSSAVIDSNPSSVVRVVRTVDGSTARPIAGTAERFEAIRSLGYSPADVLLAPCAIWVEGPSDRIYMNAWLGASGLIEGIDYQVMFYGGSLGSHLSTEMEPPNNMLAAIRALSRRCIIVADSDRKTSPRERLKPHVRRWRDEVKDDRNALLWITPGREIENVLPLETINAYRGSKKRRLMTEQTKRFGGVFDGITRPTKVELAALVVSQDPLPPTEIQADVARMVRFVVDSRDRGGAA